MQFTIDNYKPQKQEMYGGKIIKTGKRNDRFWRKDILDDGIRIYYDSVPGKNKRYFDKIIDNIRFEQL